MSARRRAGVPMALMDEAPVAFDSAGRLPSGLNCRPPVGAGAPSPPAALRICVETSAARAALCVATWAVRAACRRRFSAGSFLAKPRPASAWWRCRAAAERLRRLLAVRHLWRGFARVFAVHLSCRGHRFAFSRRPRCPSVMPWRPALRFLAEGLCDGEISALHLEMRSAVRCVPYSLVCGGSSLAHRP